MSATSISASEPDAAASENDASGEVDVAIVEAAPARVVPEDKAKAAAVSAKGGVIGQTGKKERERRKLDVKSKEWDGLMKAAKAEMGGMKPSESAISSTSSGRAVLINSTCGAGQQHPPSVFAWPSDLKADSPEILRVFDMTSKYGPSVGMTRLQRWERAKKWGLNPPEEVRDPLTFAAERGSLCRSALSSPQLKGKMTPRIGKTSSTPGYRSPHTTDFTFTLYSPHHIVSTSSFSSGRKLHLCVCIYVCTSFID